MTHQELAKWCISHHDVEIPSWADPIYFFTCQCGKTHMRSSGNHCPCGLEILDQHRHHVYR